MDEIVLLFGFGFVIGLPIGALAGLLIPVRRRWIAVPTLGLAIAWFASGFFRNQDDDSDLGRTAGMLLAALVIGGIYLGFVAALGTGRQARRMLSARRRASGTNRAAAPRD
ncbi:MAG TPA: hypothetical protein VH760_04975 [Gaiellaceae bacterium]|jgi:hypothetical protein